MIQCSAAQTELTGPAYPLNTRFGPSHSSQPMVSQAPANSGWEPQWLCLNKAPSNPGVIQHPGIFHTLVFPVASPKPCTPAAHVLVLMFLLSWCTLDTSPRHCHLYTQCRVYPSVWTLWRGVPLHQGIQALDVVLTPPPSAPPH